MSRSFSQLTQPTRDVYEYVLHYWRVHQHGPTIREILAGTGASSTSMVSYRLKVLEAEGYLVKVCPDHKWLRPVGGV